MPREVDLRFIALLSPFYRTEGPVCGGKVGHVKSPEFSPRSSGVGCFHVR